MFDMCKSKYHGFLVVFFLVYVLGCVMTAPNESQMKGENSTWRPNIGKPQRLTILLRKPRLRLRTTTAESVTTVMTNNTAALSTSEDISSTTISTTTSAMENPITTTKTTKSEEVLDSSSTEDKHFVAWPLRRRASSRRFRPPKAPSTTNKPLLKLRKPKPSRPAMYSLDGFVPKPSLKFKPTTEAPADILAFKMDLQALGSFTRRSKVKFTNDAGDEDLPTVRRYKNKSRKKLIRKTPSGRYRTFHKKGLPEIDFPAYEKIPLTTFSCSERENAGMYADPEARCQVWHMCPGGNSQHRHSFLCPNGTVFSERRRICDWWYNVDC